MRCLCPSPQRAAKRTALLMAKHPESKRVTYGKLYSQPPKRSCPLGASSGWRHWQHTLRQTCTGAFLGCFFVGFYFADTTALSSMAFVCRPRRFIWHYVGGNGPAFLRDLIASVQLISRRLDARRSIFKLAPCFEPMLSLTEQKTW